MRLQQLDHVTMHTANVGGLARFYEGVLGLRSGARPAFANTEGAWLYLNDRPLVHLLEEPKARRADNPQIQRFAFLAEGLAEFLATRRRRNVACDCQVVPGSNVRQVHVQDPDGNHVEIDFQPHEDADLAGYAGD